MRKAILVLLLALCALPLRAQLQRAYDYGVMPTENVTSLEINPVLNVLDDSAGISSSQLVAKMYRVINPAWNWGIEVPLARYESPEKSVSGLGDVMTALNWMHPESLNGGFGYGVKLESFLPTATDKRLGSGKMQTSPAVFALWSWSNGIYVAAGYKHYWSVCGDRHRDDINLGRLRLNVSYLSNTKWWVQANVYYYQDFKNKGQMEVVPEVELGTLITVGTGLYLNASTHAAGNKHSKDWSVSVGFKVLYL